MSIKVFCGTASMSLASDIVADLSVLLGHCVTLGEMSGKRFDDKELFVKVEESVRGEDVFVVQSTSSPANETLMELLIIIDALKRASAGRVTAVIPYFGYARQDRKTSPRTAITAKLVADLITVSGADRVITIDLHSPQIQGFFNIPVDHLLAGPLFVKYIEERYSWDDKLTIVSPDAGGAARAHTFAKYLGVPLAVMSKRRNEHNKVETMEIIGDVKGRDIFIFDDMCDTAGTLLMAADVLKEKGAEDVRAAVTHPVLSGWTMDRIEQSESLTELIITDTIKLEERIEDSDKIQIVSVAGLLAQAIRCIYTDDSIGALYSYK